MNGKGILGQMEDPLQAESENAGKKIVYFLGITTYLIVLGFTLAHNFNLIVGGVDESVRWIAIIGVIALELNAIALPLAFHYWTTEPIHRGAALLFYAVDLLLLYANTVIDSTMVSGGGLTALSPTGWELPYLHNFAQVSPVYSLLVWSVLFSLDPINQARERVRKMIAHSQLLAINAVDDYLQSNEFKGVIAQQGEQIGKYVVDQAFSDKKKHNVTVTKPERVISGGNGYHTMNLDVGQATLKKVRGQGENGQ